MENHLIIGMVPMKGGNHVRIKTVFRGQNLSVYNELVRATNEMLDPNRKKNLKKEQDFALFSVHVDL